MAYKVLLVCSGNAMRMVQHPVIDRNHFGHYQHFDNIEGLTNGGHAADRAHLIDDVIANLEKDPEHYATCSLTYQIGEIANAEIFEVFSSAGVL